MDTLRIIATVWRDMFPKGYQHCRQGGMGRLASLRCAALNTYGDMHFCIAMSRRNFDDGTYEYQD